MAKVPQGQKRTRRQMEESEEVPPVVDQRNVRPRFDDSSQKDAADEWNDHPMPTPAINPWNAPQGIQYREGDSSSAPPPAVPHPQLPRNAGSNSGPLSAWKPTSSAIPPLMQGKRGRAEADPDHEDSQDATLERRVLSWLERFFDTASISTAGSSGPPASLSLSRLFNTAAGPGAAQVTTSRGVPSSNGFYNSLATSATPSASQLDPSLRSVQGHQLSAQPVESLTTVLRTTSRRSGPTSGGIKIWLGGEELTKPFTLYARFGTQVAATVSSIFPLLPQSSSNIHIRRFRMRRCWHVYFPLQVIPAV